MDVSIHFVVRHHSWRWRSCCHRSAQHVDDVPGRDVPGVTVHDVELLAVLIGAGVRVGVAIDGLQCPFGILEHHLLVLLLVVLLDNLLLALLVPRGCAIAVRLLFLLLVELLCKLLDFPALLRAVALGVVHWALWTALITARGLSRPLVSTLEM
jgi:hypothetical protein